MIIPKRVNFILRTLEGNGYTAYIVGGCVRDTLMGIRPKDWDVATSALPEQVKECFDKTYDTGIEHGTVTVMIEGKSYEVTTYRIDGEYKDFRHPETVSFSGNIHDDLKRRDFTINAIAYNERDGVIDPFGGEADIRRRLIRGVGDPAERIREDALRMLRAVRICAKLGFSIEENTSKAILENSGLILRISHERVRDELFGIITSDNTDAIFTEEFLTIIGYISPPLKKSIIENREMLARLFSDCRREKALRLAVLVFFLEEEDEVRRFLKWLKLSNKLYNRILSIHRVRYDEVDYDYYSVVKAVNKWGVSTFDDYIYIRMLECLARDENYEDVTMLEELYNVIAFNQYPVFAQDLAINGYDLINEFKITGRAIGRTLDMLLDYVHRNPNENSYYPLIKEAYSIITSV